MTTGPNDNGPYHGDPRCQPFVECPFENQRQQGLCCARCVAFLNSLLEDILKVIKHIFRENHKGRRQLRRAIPDRSAGKRKFPHRRGPHFRGETGRFGRSIAAFGNLHRIQKMFMQVIDELDGAVFHGTADRRKVCHGKMLHQLTQAYAAGVREDPHSEFVRHQQYREILIDAADPRRINLNQIHRLSLEQLFENDAILSVLSG
jgi:hypothetical protein